MIEYLVKRTDGDWFDFPVGSHPYRPITIPFDRQEGAEEWKIIVEGCPISFSYEDPGIQITFEGEIEPNRAADVVEEIRQQIEHISNQTGEAIQISY